MLSTISPFLTYSVGTCVCASTFTARYGVSRCPRTIRRARADQIRLGRISRPWSKLLSHHLFGGGQRLDERRAANSRSAYFISGAAGLASWMP